MTRWRARLGRPLGRLAVALLGLELFFAVRIATLALVDPASTTFQRTQAWRLAANGTLREWQQRWQPYAAIAPTLKRAVVAAEDAGFVEHSGVEWDAIEKAWTRNQRVEAKQQQANAAAPTRPARPAKVVGGSTISQQLAKNLLLAGERTFLRKTQELALTYELEALLGKRRILEIYLNSVEWGEGVFGAEAAARRYFGVGANALSAAQAAQLAVMLPAPKRFEKRFGSPYLLARAAAVQARMGAVDIP